MSVLERRDKRRPKRRRRRRPKPTVTPPTAPTPPPTPPEVTTPYVGPELAEPVVLSYPLGLPDSRTRLFLNRFGTGYTPVMLARLNTRGGAEQWLEWQLNPTSVPESPKAGAIDDWFAYLRNTPAQIAADNKSDTRAYWRHNFGYSNWVLMRRVYSERVVLEQMSTFLNNVLHISALNDSTAPYRFDYELMIRRHAFGRFEDLPEFFGCGVAFGDHKVIPNGAVKHEALLGDIANGVAEIRFAHAANALAVDGDVTAFQFIEPCQQIDNGAFSSPCGTDEGDHLTGFGLQ